MPNFTRVMVAVTSLGGIALVMHQLRGLLRQKRNLKHWERDEPLENADDWGD